jgi:hypothetical protein
LFALLLSLVVFLALSSDALHAQETARTLPAPPLRLDRAAARAAAPAVPAVEDAPHRVYLPTVVGRAEEPVAGIQREEAATLYRTHFLAYRSAAAGWTGNIAECKAGTLNTQYTDALALLVNYYRKMAGVQPIAFDAGLNGKSQAAALMMSANEDLSHAPPSSWRCYSEDGATAAGSSNLALYNGTDPKFHGITMQMEDGGDGNWFVGHRRWILYPQTQTMGVGQIPPDNGRVAATVLWIFDPVHLWDDRPPVRDGYVAWPPPGYVPAETVYPRWSYSYPEADFSAATVTMQMDGKAVPVSSVMWDHEGYGEHTLIWTPDLGGALADGQEHRVTVTVGDAGQDGKMVSAKYTVILFNPGS